MCLQIAWRRDRAERTRPAQYRLNVALRSAMGSGESIYERQTKYRCGGFDSPEKCRRHVRCSITDKYP